MIDMELRAAAQAVGALPGLNHVARLEKADAFTRGLSPCAEADGAKCAARQGAVDVAKVQPVFEQAAQGVLSSSERGIGLTFPPNSIAPSQRRPEPTRRWRQPKCRRELKKEYAGRWAGDRRWQAGRPPGKRRACHPR